MAHDEKPAACFAALLEEVRSDGPAIVVVEDVQWADEATLDILVMFGRRAADIPALMIVTYRDDGLSASDPLVAIVPNRVEVLLLEELLGPAIEHLEEWLASGTLRSEGRAAAFRHELARQAVEEAIAPHRCLALHRQLFDALRRRGDSETDPARLAHHAEAAGDEAAVLKFAQAAAARAASAGLRTDLANGAAAEPYSLSTAGDWAAAAERWRKLGCPYEAALALPDSLDENALRRSLDELRALGSRRIAAGLSGLYSPAPASLQKSASPRMPPGPVYGCFCSAHDSCYGPWRGPCFSCAHIAVTGSGCMSGRS